MEIHADPAAASLYTTRANMVGVVTNGTAVLGLGNIGALASKPVMEGKAVLFKKFANIDCFDIELNESDPERLADIVCALEPTFGAINLEDIKAPECFIVERLCNERMNIPVFHDDQHGTAIVVGAAATNALRVAEKSFEEIKVVSTGGGAAGIACLDMLFEAGRPARERLALRHCRAGPRGTRDRDDAAEGGLCAARRPPDPGRRDRRGGPFPGPLRAGGAEARDGGADGPAPDRLRARQSDPRDHARRGARGRPRGDHRHRAVGLPEPSQQRPLLPLHLSWRARRRRDGRSTTR